MFGGLNLKAGGDAEKAKEEAPAPAPSGFSFMSSNASATPAPAPAASAFSFMMGGATAAAAPDSADTASAAPAASGFSFMTSSAPAEAPKKESAPAPASGFSFLIPSPTNDAEPSAKPEASPEPESAPALAAESASAISSSFDFLNAANAPAPAAPISGMSFQPVGVAAPLASGVKKKKKMRGQKVGLGAAGAASASPAAPPTLPEPAAAVSRTTSTGSIQKDANEAANRAEAFMERMSTMSPSPPPIQPSPSDDMLAAAELAAHEAKAQMAKSAANSPGNRFTGFIRSISASRDPSVGSNDPLDRSGSSSHNESPVPPTTAAPSTAGHYKLPPLPTVVKTTRPFPEPTKPKPAPVPVRIPGMPRTPQDEFAAFRSAFADGVQRALADAARARSRRKMLSDERFVATAKARLAAQQATHAEEQLQQAADAEEYEIAEQLSAVVEAHRNELAEVEAVLESVTEQLRQIEESAPRSGAAVAECFEKLKESMAKLKEEQESQGTKDDTEALKQFAATSKQLSIENERLQQDLKHLERDESLVAEERKELETSISEQSGEFERQRDATKAALAATEREIEDLRKLLVQKQAEAAKLRTDSYGLDDSISKVRVKFSRQLNRVQKKEMSMEENRREWQKEQDAFERQREAHDFQVTTHSNALLAHDKLLTDLASELSLADKFRELVQGHIGSSSDDEQPDDELAELQARVAKREAAANKAKATLQDATTALRELESEEESLATQIPQLEATKKQAAASRDFKAASRASKAIKDATSRLEGMAELKSEAALRQSEAQEQLKECDSALVAATEDAKAKESTAAQSRMRTLADKIAELEATTKELCGTPSEDDSPFSVTAVGGQILSARLAEWRAEGKALGEKYGGWDELVGVEKEEGEGETSIVEEPAAAAAKEEAVVEPAPEAATPSAEPAAKDDPNRIRTIRDLVNTISSTEARLNQAAEEEDFDLAADLQDEFDALQSKLESMSVSDEELDQAMMLGDEEEEAPTSGEPVAEEVPSSGEIDEQATEEEAPADPVQEAESSTESAHEAPKPAPSSSSEEDATEAFVQVSKDDGEEDKEES